MEGIHGGGGGGWNAVMDDEAAELRRGPWTVEEDLALVNYISINGEGRWNSLARSAGLKRTGKSCRLRWLNYLRPDVRRGNITPEEQLLILELHSRWGNRWSKIAQHLPGRTDNEIKNYWRTRVQKHAKQLQCDVNSKQFKDVMRYLWMPRLLERIHAAAATGTSNSSASPLPAENITITQQQQQQLQALVSPENSSMAAAACCSNSTLDSTKTQLMTTIGGGGGGGGGGSSTAAAAPPVQVPVQQQIPADRDHHDRSSSTLDHWHGAGLLSSTSSSETVQTTNLSPNYPPCGYYNYNNIQDCYFAPATTLPEFDHNRDDYLWSMDYYDDQLIWPLQQQQYILNNIHVNLNLEERREDILL